MHLPIVPLDPWLAQFEVINYLHVNWGMGVFTGLVLSIMMLRYFVFWRSSQVSEVEYRRNQTEVRKSAMLFWAMVGIMLLSPILGFYILGPVFVVLIIGGAVVYVPIVGNGLKRLGGLIRELADVSLGRRV